MANTIKLKRGSGSDPGTSDLVVGEVALRTDTGKLFTKNDGGSIVEISGGVDDGDITTAKIADEAVTLAKIEHGTVNNDGKFLRANNGADPTFETITQYSASNVFSLYDQASTPVQRVLVSSEGVTIQGTSSAVSKLMFRDRTTANFLKFKPVDTLSAGVEFTLPSADGSANHVLKTDGSGVMSFGQIATASITDDAVTYAKIQNVSATNRILGRDSSGAGVIEEIAPSAVRTMLGLAASATTDTTNASNISSGTLAAARVATLNQDTTGNAATATALETARTIAGVSFDGTANISLNNNAITNGAGYITATLTNEQVQDIVGGMLTGNTETGITVTYQDSDGTIDFVVGTLNQDTTGNAATATALETARNIGGVSFDGTGNINLPGVNTSGNQDTSGTAAIATTVTVADESSDTTCFPLFATAATGNLAPKSGSNLAFNSSNGTLTATAFSGDGSALTGISAGATGGGSDEIFYENGQNVTTDYTITNGKNAMSAGPITIDSGVTVTVGAGETLTIV